MKQSTVGKRVVDELYVHLDAIQHLDNCDHRAAILAALRAVPQDSPHFPNVAKVNVRTGQLSLLCYRDFEVAPFPELQASWALRSKGSSPEFSLRLYSDSLNPPILHRKERLVAPDHPLRETWSRLTAVAESLGLFDDTSTIGFRMNWERLIAGRGFQLVGTDFLPLGNDDSCAPEAAYLHEAGTVLRHLTALNRTALSAPVQLLLRHGLLSKAETFFDYGCGRRGDVTALTALEICAEGWDPYYWPDQPIRAADVVNLGFVVNVIEDPAERVEALRTAFGLAKRVLAISVMLGSSDRGATFNDGVLTTRRTFQKYYTQPEFKDFVEQVLHEPAVMAGPGIAFVFTDKDLEQRYMSERFRSSGIAQRIMRSRRAPPRRPQKIASAYERNELRLAKRPTSKAAQQLETARPLLEALWLRCLDLGRLADQGEFPQADELICRVGSWTRALRLLKSFIDVAALNEARECRANDVAIFLVHQLLSRKTPYRKLEPRLQRDVRVFFGDHASAVQVATRLLREASEPARILAACEQAAQRGLGWLDRDHSLQLHIDLVNRLPPILRAYVACGLVLWDQTSDVQLVKIHITSGKLTLLEFDDFDSRPCPSLRRRVKVDLRRLNCEVFDYGGQRFPATVLIGKSRYMNEDMPEFEEQCRIDLLLESVGVTAEWTGTQEDLREHLDKHRLTISNGKVIPSTSLPSLDEPCGSNFTYRSFIECGETQRVTKTANVPTQPETYNALHALAKNVLDPVVDYFGGISLTYGVCGCALGKLISKRVAPRLDQHASHELNSKGRRICERDGAACDFIVDDEDMLEVAHWIRANVPFDRLYYYGSRRPIHVSFGPELRGEAYEMTLTSGGKLMPRQMK